MHLQTLSDFELSDEYFSYSNWNQQWAQITDCKLC